MTFFIFYFSEIILSNPGGKVKWISKANQEGRRACKKRATPHGLF
jgi:hypothetical protein